MTPSPMHAESRPLALEPSLIEIPAAWFLMGFNTGQDCERPIHRVWVDAFLLAATQVTNAEFARFLTQRARRRPRSGTIQTSTIPDSPLPDLRGSRPSDTANG